MGGAMALKHWFVTLLLALVAAVAARAQGGGEQDFASRFMSLYGKGRAVECTTVSPLMLERMMQLPDVEGDSHTREVLKQLKSIRLVSSTAGHDVTHLMLTRAGWPNVMPCATSCTPNGLANACMCVAGASILWRWC